MKTELVQIVFFTFALVLAAAVQETVPSFGGSKPPLLLLAALCVSLRPDPPPDPESARSRHRMRNFGWLAVAVAAGTFADALDMLPFGCMAVFAAFACAAARLVRDAVANVPFALTGLVTGALAAPCQEIWLDLWLPSGSETTLVRFFASAPAAAAAGAVIFSSAPRIVRLIGLDGIPSSERSGKG